MKSINHWFYQLPNGDTAPNMKELRALTGKSVTTLRKLIQKEIIMKIYTEQKLRSYDTTEELRVR